MKLNKNGIPILDPPGNKMAKKRVCLPDEHKWVEDAQGTERASQAGQWYDTCYECVKCGDKMVETNERERNFDGIG